MGLEAQKRRRMRVKTTLNLLGLFHTWSPPTVFLQLQSNFNGRNRSTGGV